MKFVCAHCETPIDGEVGSVVYGGAELPICSKCYDDPVNTWEALCETEQRRIALALLATGPQNARSLASLLPASVGAKSKDPSLRRREVAGAILRALKEEGFVKGPDVDGYFWKVRS